MLDAPRDSLCWWQPGTMVAEIEVLPLGAAPQHVAQSVWTGSGSTAVYSTTPHVHRKQEEKLSPTSGRT